MTTVDAPMPVLKKRTPSLSPRLGLWLLGLSALLAGSVGLYQRFDQGLLVTNLGSYVPWGLWVAVYEYLVWLEVGSLIVFTLLVYVFRWNTTLPRIARLLYLTALAILAMALILIGLDLGHPFRFWHVFASPQWGSLMTWMIWLHVIYMAVLLAKLFVEAYGRSTQAKRLGVALALVSLPLGVGLVVIAGSVFGVVIGRPAWQGSLLPLFFLLSAITAGAGLLTFQFVWFRRGNPEAEYLSTARRLGRLLLALLLVVLTVEMLSGLTVLYPGVPAQATAIQLTLFGPYWWVYWAYHVGLGVLLPIVILLTRTQTARRIGVAAGLFVITFIGVPLNIVIPPQLVVEVAQKGLIEAFTGPGLVATYFPSAAEWLVTLFAFAFGFLVFLAGYQLLGIRTQEMKLAPAETEAALLDKEG